MLHKKKIINAITDGVRLFFRKRLMYAVLPAVLVFVSCSPDTPSRPSAVGGVLDLSGWDFTQGRVSLQGEWDFFWQEFIDPVRGRRAPAVRDFADVPGVWKDTRSVHGSLPGQGFASYRLRLLLPEKRENLSLRLYTVSSAYRLYADGRCIASTGIPGVSKDSSIPAYLPVLSPVDSSRKEIDLVLHVSNFHYRSGGPWRDIIIGHDRDLQQEKLWRTFGTIFLFGSLFAMSVYHLILFLYRRSEKPYLYFAFFSFLMAVRSVSAGEYLVAQMFPGVPFSLMIRIEYISFYLSITGIALFFYSIFPHEIRRRAVLGIGCVSFLFSLFVSLFPTEIFTYSIHYFYLFTALAVVYLLRGLVSACIRKRQASGYFLTGGIIMLVSAVNDVLYSSFMIHTANIAALGILFFIIMQTIALSKRYTAAFANVERLSDEMIILNRDLEDKVNERTSELLNAYNQIMEISIRDPLTGCYNRRHMQEEFPKEIERAVRYSHPLSIILCDIDHFKTINDSFGHLAGDHAIVEFTKIISACIRGNIDWVCRYGGEEFMIVLPETPVDTAAEIAERIRSVLEKASISYFGAVIAMTSSFGVAGFDALSPETRVNREEIFEKADHLLYEAKRSGRNRIVSLHLK